MRKMFKYFTGGMGRTDEEFSSTVRSAKIIDKDMRLILVKPYFSNELNTNKEYYQKSYDDIIPSEVVSIHYKAAIEKRNHWMVEQSHYIVACVYRNFSGAFTAIRYAEGLGKTIIKCAKQKNKACIS